MAKNNNLTDFVRDLADGFREKLGWPETDKINPQDFRSFVVNSPAVGTLKNGIESLNWTKKIQNDAFESVYCPTDTIELESYFDSSTGTQRLPLIQFTIESLDPIVGDGEVRIYDDISDATIGHFTAADTGVIKYILPVFANVSNPQKYPFFPSFTIFVTGVPEAGVRIKMEASWVQIGAPDYPMLLSGSTMRGYK